MNQVMFLLVKIAKTNPRNFRLTSVDIYTFSFEPNPDWTSFYAKGSEIQAYIKRTAQKYGLDKDVKFNSKVIESVWDEKAKKWKIKIEQDGAIIEDEADVLINGSGVLKSVPELFLLSILLT